MFHSLRGLVVGMVFIAGVGAWSAIDRGANYTPATASVDMIDRKCDIVETTTDEAGQKTSRIYTDDCKSIEAWDAARAKRDKSISGEAVMTVSYVAPQDGSYRTSQLRYTSHDNEFYDLKAGDEVQVLISNDDPAKIIKA